MRTRPVQRCPSCGAGDVTDLRLGDHVVGRCTVCGLVRALEMADPDEVYVEGYCTGNSPFGYDGADADFQRFLVHCGRRRLAAIAAIVGDDALSPLLDVGCGAGDLLVAAAERGIAAVGVEPIAESAALAAGRGLDVRTTAIEDAGLDEGSFALVTAYHVLEHMDDGVGFLRTLAAYVRPGGHVAVEVPNFRSMHRRGKGRAWPGLRPLEHVAHYEPVTLAATFERAGLRTPTIRTMGFRWPETTFAQAVDDIGFPKWSQRVPPDRPPGAVGRAALWAIERTYDLGKVGPVILAVACRP